MRENTTDQWTTKGIASVSGAPVMVHVTLVMRHVTIVMMHAILVMVNVTPVMVHVTPVIIHVTPVMVHVTPVMIHVTLFMIHVTSEISFMRIDLTTALVILFMVTDIFTTDLVIIVILVLMEDGLKGRMLQAMVAILTKGIAVAATILTRNDRAFHVSIKIRMTKTCLA
jgi:hypothetical protein